jgi:hypothetical protein
MTADAASLLAEIRRSGGDVRLVGCDRLKLVAPTALLSEFAEKVRAAKPMLLVSLVDTGRKATQQGGGGVSNPRRNGATAQHSTAESSLDRDRRSPSADWRARHREALAYWSAFHPAGDAERLAWGELEDRWHRLLSARVPEWQCAGCGEPIGGHPALNLADGNRLHLDKFECLLAFGGRWRSEATAGLRAVGLDPPSDLDETPPA